jgi:hypothetical protein
MTLETACVQPSNDDFRNWFVRADRERFQHLWDETNRGAATLLPDDLGLEYVRLSKRMQSKRMQSKRMQSVF